jgi:tetratricopeptide (TPR) repeat protein
LGAWAIGSAFYDCGYGSYSNPYYASNAANSGSYYDYSQPIQVVNQNPDGVANDQNTPVPPDVQEGTSHGDLARAAFKQGDYATALRENDLALKSLPQDAALHEFRALVLFATGDYQQAAATLYAVLSAGPGWDWTTLSGMYGTISTYTEQFRQLELFVTDHPDSAEGHFVLAYHYLTCNHSDSAAGQLREVIRLKPQDQLAPQLLKMITGGAANAGDGPVPQPPDADVGAAAGEESPAPAAIDAAKLVGKSIARREDGSTFTLTLSADSKFTWSFAKPGQKAQVFGGKYSVDGAILVLQRSDGAQMPGLITMSDDGFNFKLYGALPEDKGLDFKR